MIPRRISGATNWMGAPEGWRPEEDGDCSNLAVRKTMQGKIALCESAWEPTPAELAALNAGASVILRVVGGQPPVALYVDEPPDERPLFKVSA